MSKLTKLRSLLLYENQLTGEIPSWLPQLSLLETIHLYDNQLTGTIPAGLGNLQNLRSLNLHLNQLTGTIPPSLANPPLNSLRLNMNMLTGCIPDALYDITTNDMDRVNHQAYYDYETDSDIAADLLLKCSEATPGIILSKTAFSLDEGDTTGNTYMVRLQIRPSTTVTVAISGHAGNSLTLDKTRLTFTTSTWHVEQTVTVTARRGRRRQGRRVDPDAHGQRRLGVRGKDRDPGRHGLRQRLSRCHGDADVPGPG